MIRLLVLGCIALVLVGCQPEPQTNQYVWTGKELTNGVYAPNCLFKYDGGYVICNTGCAINNNTVHCYADGYLTNVNRTWTMERRTENNHSISTIISSESVDTNTMCFYRINDTWEICYGDCGWLNDSERPFCSCVKSILNNPMIAPLYDTEAGR